MGSENSGIYCIHIRTRRGIYGEIWPQPEGVPEGAAQESSRRHMAEFKFGHFTVFKCDFKAIFSIALIGGVILEKYPPIGGQHNIVPEGAPQGSSRRHMAEWSSNYDIF